MNGWAMFATRYKHVDIVSRAVRSLEPYVEGITAWVNEPVYPETVVFLHEHELVYTWEPNERFDLRTWHRPLYRRTRSVWENLGIEPDYVIYTDDDEALPEANGFSDYLGQWAASKHWGIRFFPMRFWVDFETVRVDGKPSKGTHVKIVKNVPALDFSRRPLNVHREFKDRGFPICPWPLRHYRTVTDRERSWYREHYHSRNLKRPDRPSDLTAPHSRGVPMMRYDPNITVKRYREIIETAEDGGLPEGCWLSKE